MTTDQNIRHQHYLEGRQLGVVLLATAWSEVRLRATEIGQGIAAAVPGEIVEVPIRVD